MQTKGVKRKTQKKDVVIQLKGVITQQKGVITQKKAVMHVTQKKGVASRLEGKARLFAFTRLLKGVITPLYRR